MTLGSARKGSLIFSVIGSGSPGVLLIVPSEVQSSMWARALGSPLLFWMSFDLWVSDCLARMKESPCSLWKEEQQKLFSQKSGSSSESSFKMAPSQCGTRSEWWLRVGTSWFLKKREWVFPGSSLKILVMVAGRTAAVQNFYTWAWLTLCSFLRARNQSFWQHSFFSISVFPCFPVCPLYSY